jgi:hypothetical protein
VANPFFLDITGLFASGRQNVYTSEESMTAKLVPSFHDHPETYTYIIYIYILYILYVYIFKMKKDMFSAAMSNSFVL